MKEVREAHYRQARSVLEEYKGNEIKTIGDSFMIAFRTAVQALNFALKLQRDPGSERVRIRVGIHVGPVRVESKDAFGSMVDYTARVQHCAAGAELWVSNRAHADIELEKSKAHAHLKWKQHANLKLKGFKERQTLWSLETASEKA